jgi:hypothetical protein
MDRCLLLIFIYDLTRPIWIQIFYIKDPASFVSWLLVVPTSVWIPNASPEDDTTPSIYRNICKSIHLLFATQPERHLGNVSFSQHESHGDRGDGFKLSNKSGRYFMNDDGIPIILKYIHCTSYVRFTLLRWMSTKRYWVGKDYFELWYICCLPFFKNMLESQFVLCRKNNYYRSMSLFRLY